MTVFFGFAFSCLVNENQLFCCWFFQALSFGINRQNVHFSIFLVIFLIQKTGKVFRTASTHKVSYAVLSRNYNWNISRAGVHKAK